MFQLQSLCSRLIVAIVATGSFAALAGAAPEAGDLPALRGPLESEVREPKASDLDKSKGQHWVRAKFDVSGSMCLSCLLQLEEKLRELPGLAFAKVEHPPVLEVKPGEKPPTKPRTTQATIIYDRQSIQFARLITWMKREKYKPLNLSEAPLVD